MFGRSHSFPPLIRLRVPKDANGAATQWSGNETDCISNTIFEQLNPVQRLKYARDPVSKYIRHNFTALFLHAMQNVPGCLMDNLRRILKKPTPPPGRTWWMQTTIYEEEEETCFYYTITSSKVFRLQMAETRFSFPKYTSEHTPLCYYCFDFESLKDGSKYQLIHALFPSLTPAEDEILWSTYSDTMPSYLTMVKILEDQKRKARNHSLKRIRRPFSLPGSTLEQKRDLYSLKVSGPISAFVKEPEPIAFCISGDSKDKKEQEQEPTKPTTSLSSPSLSCSPSSSPSSSPSPSSSLSSSSSSRVRRTYHKVAGPQPIKPPVPETTETTTPSSEAKSPASQDQTIDSKEDQHQLKEPIPVLRICRVCYETTHLVCSRCNLANYCSEACQRQDYPRHKSTCKQWRYWKHEAEVESKHDSTSNCPPVCSSYQELD